eukprot:scpid76093/ scgid17089/ 
MDNSTTNSTITISTCPSFQFFDCWRHYVGAGAAGFVLGGILVFIAICVLPRYCCRRYRRRRSKRDRDAESSSMFNTQMSTVTSTSLSIPSFSRSLGGGSSKTSTHHSGVPRRAMVAADLFVDDAPTPGVPVAASDGIGHIDETMFSMDTNCQPLARGAAAAHEAVLAASQSSAVAAQAAPGSTGTQQPRRPSLSVESSTGQQQGVRKYSPGTDPRALAEPEPGAMPQPPPDHPVDQASRVSVGSIGNRMHYINPLEMSDRQSSGEATTSVLSSRQSSLSLTESAKKQQLQQQREGGAASAGVPVVSPQARYHIISTSSTSLVPVQTSNSLLSSTSDPYHSLAADHHPDGARKPDFDNRSLQRRSSQLDDFAPPGSVVPDMTSDLASVLAAAAAATSAAAGAAASSDPLENAVAEMQNLMTHGKIPRQTAPLRQTASPRHAFQPQTAIDVVGGIEQGNIVRQLSLQNPQVAHEPLSRRGYSQPTFPPVEVQIGSTAVQPANLGRDARNRQSAIAETGGRSSVTVSPVKLNRHPLNQLDSLASPVAATATAAHLTHEYAPGNTNAASPASAHGSTASPKSINSRGQVVLIGLGAGAAGQDASSDEAFPNPSRSRDRDRTTYMSVLKELTTKDAARKAN